MMNNLFIPYGLALKLKELGFAEKCIARINQIGAIHIKGTRRLPSGAMCYNEVDAPTWEQAFDWFITKDFRFNILFSAEDQKYWIDIWRIENELAQFYFESELIYLNYPEARKACLEKLIETQNSLK